MANENTVIQLPEDHDVSRRGTLDDLFLAVANGHFMYPVAMDFVRSVMAGGCTQVKHGKRCVQRKRRGMIPQHSCVHCVLMNKACRQTVA